MLCIGDLMLDEFVYGEVSRVSPEAPAPVIAVKRSETIIGGAGNVARNIVSLGARCVFVGVVGDDDAGQVIARGSARSRNAIEPHLISTPRGRPPARCGSCPNIIRRICCAPTGSSAATVTADIEDVLIAKAIAALPRVGAVVLSDYAKGVLTPRVIRAVIDAARRLNKPVVVDPKAHDYAVYRGATIITPNRKELSDHTRRPVSTDEEIAAAAADLAATVGSAAVLATLSEDGMFLHVDGAEPIHIPAYPVKVRDVSGAGDTVVATLAGIAREQGRF